jgi:hypothetical protein
MGRGNLSMTAALESALASPAQLVPSVGQTGSSVMARLFFLAPILHIWPVIVVREIAQPEVRQESGEYAPFGA